MLVFLAPFYTRDTELNRQIKRRWLRAHHRIGIIPINKIMNYAFPPRLKLELLGINKIFTTDNFCKWRTKERKKKIQQIEAVFTHERNSNEIDLITECFLVVGNDEQPSDNHQSEVVAVLEKKKVEFYRPWLMRLGGVSLFSLDLGFMYIRSQKDQFNMINVKTFYRCSGKTCVCIGL